MTFKLALSPLNCHPLRRGSDTLHADTRKRKFDQFLGSNFYDRITYPSPPMSNPPSPQRQPQSSTAPAEIPINIPISSLPSTAVSLPHPFTSSSLTGGFVSHDFVSSTTSTAQPAPSTYSPFGPALPQSAFLPQPEGSVGIVPQIGQPLPTLARAPSTRGGRKSKAHVASACINCKRAHVSCDVGRPCTRCVASGKQDTCVDVQHKKRGRPRLREEGEFKIDPPTAGSSTPVSNPMSIGEPSSRPIATTRSKRVRAYSSLSYQSQMSGSSSGIASPTHSHPPPPTGSRPTFALPEPPSQLSARPVYEIPTAYLNLDLIIVRANNPFRQIMVAGQEVSGRPLSEIAAPTDGGSFQAIRNRLRAERESRDPAYMPPIALPGHNMIQGLSEADVERYAADFDDQLYTWTQTQPGSVRETFPARVRLAKAGVYFVAVTLPSFRPTEPPMVPQPLPPLFPRSAQSQTPDTYGPPSRPLTGQASPTGYYTYPGPGLPTASPTSIRPTGSYTYPPPQPILPFQPPPPRPPAYSPYQLSTPPRLPIAEPPTETTMFTPRSSARKLLPQASSGAATTAAGVQLPPIAGGSASGGAPLAGPADVARDAEGAGATATSASAVEGEEDDGRQTRKRRRTGIGIDDVLHR